MENLYSFIKESHYRNNKSAQNNSENYFVDHFFLLGSDYNLRLPMNKSSAWKPSSNKYIAAVTSNQVQIKLYLLVGSKHTAAIRTWTAALNTSSRCRNGNKASAQRRRHLKQETRTTKLNHWKTIVVYYAAKAEKCNVARIILTNKISLFELLMLVTWYWIKYCRQIQ